MEDEDWGSVAEIYKQGMDGGNATFETSVPPYERWDAAHLKECRFVAVSRGELVGWAALSPVSARYVYRGVMEVSVYVADSHKRRGVGRMLLEALTSESERLGIWMLQSGIMAENEPSIRLHHACGFRVVGTRKRVAQDSHGVWRDNVMMERRSGVA
jgi:phosphinothricin acetyltransferase